MIDQIQLPVLICTVQVSFIALLGFVVVSLLLRQRPALSSSLACATFFVILGLTLSMPLPDPGWLTWKSVSTVKPPADSSVLNTTTTVARDANEHENQNGSPLLLNLSPLVSNLRSLGSSENRPTSRTTGWMALSVMSAFILFGLAKFTLGLFGSWKLVRASRRLEDEPVIRMADSIAQSLSLRRPVQIAQCDSITSAAVAGCSRPTVLLPAQWRRWTHVELESVLAHELAHIARSDYAWRVVSCLMTSMHYYNPLVHLLVRRLALAQEITADTLAATAVGQQRYVKALSSLALEQDDSQSCFTQTGIHPVFSGYLIRRIKMLKSKQNWKDAHCGAVTKWAGIAVILTVGLITFSTRGLAQPPEAAPAQDAPTERVARANSKTPIKNTQPRRDFSPPEPPDPTESMFRRETVDLSIVPINETGFISIRLSEIFREVKADDAVKVINQMFSAGLKDCLGSDELPSFDLNLINELCGTFTLTAQQRKAGSPPPPEVIEPIVNAKSEEVTNENVRNFLSFGIGDLLASFKQPVDAAAWVSRFSPTAETYSHGQHEWFLLPPFPAFGAAQTALANSDANTIYFSSVFTAQTPKNEIAGSANGLNKQLDHSPRLNRSSWARAFQRIDGGLVTLVSTNKEIRTPKEFDEEFEGRNLPDEKELEMMRTLHDLEHTFETFAIGIDLSHDARTVGVRIRLGNHLHSETERMQTNVRTLIEAYRDGINSPSESEMENTGPMLLAAMKQFFDAATVNYVDNPDGSSEVCIHTAIDLPVSAATVLYQMVLEVNAENSAERQTASRDSEE